MIKVLIIVPTRFGYDGISNVVKNYYIYQNHEEFKIDFITINEIDKNFKSQIKINDDNHYILEMRNNNPIKYTYKLKKIIKKNCYDIVHVHGCSSTLFFEMLASKLAGVKVRIAHSHNTTCDHVKINKFLKPFFLSLCTHGFACSNDAGKWLFESEKFEVIPNGIHLDKFTYDIKTREEYREKYKLKNKLVIGHVGRFSKQKNHLKLIKIFEKISQIKDDVKLVLIGDGELKTEIEKIVKDKKIDVLFVGESNDIEKWLQAMDIMIFPSLFEGLPLSIIEAQGAGVPCLLSSTISKMTAITNLVKFIDLNDSSEVWAEKVLDIDIKNRINNCKEIKDEIINSNFDIESNCRKLELKYRELLVSKN